MTTKNVSRSEGWAKTLRCDGDDDDAKDENDDNDEDENECDDDNDVSEETEVILTKTTLKKAEKQPWLSVTHGRTDERADPRMSICHYNSF